MPYAALRNMSLQEPGKARPDVHRQVSGLTALTSLAVNVPDTFPCLNIDTVVYVRNQG